jgi:cytochrome c oxidase subunit III
VSATATAVSGGSTAQALATPETITAEEVQGNNNERLAIALFIVSEAVMFAAFFAQYFYNRLLAPIWPTPTGLPEGFTRVPAFPIAFVLTILLVLSGFSAHAAQTAIRRDDRDAFTGWLVVTIVLGLGFLGGQVFEYLSLFREGFTISSGIYGSVFFTMTGLHGIHVTAGLAVLIFVLIRGFLGQFSSTNHFAVEGSVLYWHFVDVVWLALYGALYLF